MTQTSLYDQAKRAKQQGMEAAYEAANTRWRDAAAARVLYLAQTRKTFTSDDVITYLDAKGIITGSNKALGAVMVSAKRMGLIESTDTQVRCRRKARHHGWVMVWRSTLKA